MTNHQTRYFMFIVLLLAVAVSIWADSVATPAITVPSGTKYNSVTTSIGCTTPGATIYYTTDGSEPNPSSQASKIYSYGGSALVFTTHTTLKARAFKTGMTISALASAVYRIKMAPPHFSLAPGTFTTPQTVKITCPSPGATIYYNINYTTANGPAPSNSSTPYSNPLLVDQPMTTIKATAFKTGTDQTTASATYYIVAGQVTAPTFAPPSASVTSVPYVGNLTVTIVCTTPGATIYYKIGGGVASSTSQVYGGAFSLGVETHVSAIAIKAGMTNSAVVHAEYKRKLATPSITPATKTFTTTSITVAVSCPPAAKLRYTTDGSTPITSSTSYPSSGFLIFPGTTTLKVVAFPLNNPSWIASEVATAIYTKQ